MFLFWDSGLSLLETDQKFKFGGLIGCGNFYLEPVFRYSKVFRMHAKLRDAAGSARLQTGKGPGYCYVIGRGPNCCLLGDLTGLLICLYLKIFLPSIFNSIGFWKSISLIVLDIELSEKTILKELGHFVEGSLQGFSFCPPNAFKPNKQMTWNTSHLLGIAWSNGKLEYGKLFAVFYDIEVMNAEVFAKGLEKCRLLSRLLGQKVEKLDDYRCPKTQDLVGEGKTNLLQLPFPTQNKASLCREEKAKVYGERAVQHLNLLILYVSILFDFTTNLIP